MKETTNVKTENTIMFPGLEVWELVPVLVVVETTPVVVADAFVVVLEEAWVVVGAGGNLVLSTFQLVHPVLESAQ